MTRDEFDELLLICQEIEEGIYATRKNPMDDRATTKVWLQNNVDKFPIEWMYTIRRKVLQNVRQCYYVSWPSVQNSVNLRNFVCDLCAAGSFCVETEDALDKAEKKSRWSVAFFEEADAIIGIGLAESYGLANPVY